MNLAIFISSLRGIAKFQNEVMYSKRNEPNIMVVIYWVEQIIYRKLFVKFLHT